MSQRLHILLLSAGRVFSLPRHGGEEKFSVALGEWLARQSHCVTLMGIDHAGIRAKRILKPGDRENDVMKQKALRSKNLKKN